MAMDKKKVCVITGATSGIGYAIAKGLAAENTDLILIARTHEKGQAVVAQLKKETGNTARYYVADLSSQRQVREAGSAIRSDHPVIDVLINNAGVVASKRELTEDQIEKQFAVNHLAYFFLTHVLYRSIARSENGRIINIASDSHHEGNIHFDNINLTNKYNPLRAYGQSKLANVLFTFELHRIKPESKISVYCVQPGLVNTDIGVKNTNLLHAFVWKVRRLFGMSPEEAAQTPVYLATSPEVAHKSGLYWEKCQPKHSSPESKNAETAKRLWKMSESMCAIKNYFDPE
jgi:retinol dehydrogenase-12